MIENQLASTCKLSKWPENDQQTSYAKLRSGNTMQHQHLWHLIVHVRWVAAVTTLDPLKHQVPRCGEMGFPHGGRLSSLMGSWLQ